MSKKYRILNDKEWLYQKYWVEELTTPQIAKIVGCDFSAVLRALRKLGIPRRTMSEAQRGEKNHNYGKHLSEETKAKIAEKNKGRHHTEEARRKISKANEGRPVSEETKRKISESERGKKVSEETRRKLSEAGKGEKHPMYGRRGEDSPVYGKHPSEETRGKMSEAQKGKHHTEEAKAKIREARKHRIFPKHHTKPELIFEEICKRRNLPFKYTGNGDFWIENINPDFIECNGKKIAIEVFGDYWHSPLLNSKLGERSTLTYRKRMLKKYGWKLIVFWETDLKREDAEQFVSSELKKHKVF